MVNSIVMEVCGRVIDGERLGCEVGRKLEIEGWIGLEMERK
jgi:hypothetical protein